MRDSAMEAVLKHDRAIVLAALIALAALAWAHVLWLSTGMAAAPAPMPDMPGMIMAPALQSWGGAELLTAFAMWTTMMAGMMLPSAAPMILLYVRVARQGEKQGKPFASAAWFAGGYLLAWTGFALAASLAQAALLQAAVISPMLASTSLAFGGIVLIAAGLYQWTPLKDACLAFCQGALQFIQSHGGFKRGAAPSLRLGLTHGLYCVGCCWALMALLFVVGVMNLLWIAALALWVLWEKIVPLGKVMPRTLGLVLILAGAIFLYRTAI